MSTETENIVERGPGELKERAPAPARAGLVRRGFVALRVRIGRDAASKPRADPRLRPPPPADPYFSHTQLVRDNLL